AARPWPPARRAGRRAPARPRQPPRPPAACRAPPRARLPPAPQPDGSRCTAAARRRTHAQRAAQLERARGRGCEPAAAPHAGRGRCREPLHDHALDGPLERHWASPPYGSTPGTLPPRVVNSVPHALVDGLLLASPLYVTTHLKVP